MCVNAAVQCGQCNRHCCNTLMMLRNAGQSHHKMLAAFQTLTRHTTTPINRLAPQINNWTHWGLNPRPSACEADVIPLNNATSDEFHCDEICMHAAIIIIGILQHARTKIINPFCMRQMCFLFCAPPSQKRREPTPNLSEIHKLRLPVFGNKRLCAYSGAERREPQRKYRPNPEIATSRFETLTISIKINASAHTPAPQGMSQQPNLAEIQKFRRLYLRQKQFLAKSTPRRLL